MKINTAWKKIVLLIFLGSLLAGCDFTYHGDEEEQSEESGNSGGEDDNGSGVGIPILVEGVWTDGTISKDGQLDKYSITVAAETRYFIRLNDATDGDDTKTANHIGLKISHSDGTVISSWYSNVTDCWKKPFTFRSLSDGTVTITAANNSSSSGNSYYWELGTGTYAIRYTSRPEYDTLSEGIWKNDDIITDGQTNKYKISVVAGQIYSIYLNDKNGDDSKTANKIGLKIKYTQDSNSNYPVICDDYDRANKLFSKPYQFTAPSDGTIIITAANNSSSSGNSYYWELGTGTYAIKYETVN